MTRRSLTWLVAIPLVMSGSQLGHLLAYRLVYPEAHVRLRELVVTGHGYLDYAPIALGVAAAAVVASLAFCVADSARGCRR